MIVQYETERLEVLEMYGCELELRRRAGQHHPVGNRIRKSIVTSIIKILLKHNGFIANILERKAIGGRKKDADRYI